MCVCVQVLVQLFCSKRISAILMFYHLETKTANYFCISYDGDYVHIIVTCEGNRKEECTNKE